jgi:hypothetical protein
MGFVARSVATPTIAMAKGDTTGSAPVATGFLHLQAERFFTRLNFLY